MWQGQIAGNEFSAFAIGPLLMAVVAALGVEVPQGGAPLEAEVQVDMDAEMEDASSLGSSFD